MPKPKHHRHSRELELGYGYAYASGWKGIGACYYCKGCSQVLWFEDDMEIVYPNEHRFNERKRKRNKRYNPHESKPS